MLLLVNNLNVVKADVKKEPLVFSGAILAISAVANGVAVSSTATTIAAGVFVGSSVALASTAYSAMIESDTAEEFAKHGEEALIATAASGVAGGISANSLPGHNCFIAGTLVHTPDGNVPIERIKQGDLVWAWDEETGEVSQKAVVETYVNETDELVHVFVNGEEIITTPSHPFYSPVKGWTDAIHLRAGDILVLVNGEYVVIEWIQHEILESPVTVYNFQVADYHTYYVTDNGVLVHNSCNHGSAWNKEKRKHWIEESQKAVEGYDYGAYVATKSNIERMAKGLAPIGWDGNPVHLHHWKGIANDFYNYSSVSRTLHQLIHKLK